MSAAMLPVTARPTIVPFEIDFGVLSAAAEVVAAAVGARVITRTVVTTWPWSLVVTSAEDVGGGVVMTTGADVAGAEGGGAFDVWGVDVAAGDVG